MNWKKIVLVITILLSTGIYFMFFYKDKNLKYIPENADVLVLIDVKNVTRQYISSYLTHPSKWFENQEKDKNKISISDSGLEIPDFIQIFHLKNTRITDWYTVFEIDDKAKFLAFLKNRKFVNVGKDRFKNEKFFIRIDGETCFVGTSDLHITNFGKPFYKKFRNSEMNADSFIESGIGSISILSELRTQNFSIEINDDEIEIKNNKNSDSFKSLIADLQNKTQFLKAELDQDNIQKICSFSHLSFADSASINSLKITAELEEVNDTIISYGYDDNFNEIEKLSYQKIIQPNYEIILQSKNLDKTWTYFQDKKWINSQNQFTAIPFQPNLISKNEKQISIISTRKSIKKDEKKNQNYIFIKNNSLLFSTFKSLNISNKSLFANIDYLFYGNKNQDYIVKIKFKKEKLPLILR